MGLWTLWVTGMLSIKSTGQIRRAGRVSYPQIPRKTQTWEQLSEALRSQSGTITDLIQNEEGPQRQHNAQQAFGNLNEALREYFAPIDEMAA